MFLYLILELNFLLRQFIIKMIIEKNIKFDMLLFDEKKNLFIDEVFVELQLGFINELYKILD